MDPVSIVIGLCSIMFALLIHEYAHAFMSYQLGDPTAKYEGRLSFNPVVHFEPVGAICLVVSYVTSGGMAIMGWNSHGVSSTMGLPVTASSTTYAATATIASRPYFGDIKL